MGIPESWKEYDMMLENVKMYCHPDAPTEIIVHSKNSFHFSSQYESPIMNKLYDKSKKNEKITVVLNINGRKVELARNPIIGDRLTVTIYRSPKDTRLTFVEARNILKEVEKILGVEINWGRPFPRGSC
jgi:hypothetical protein